MSKQARQKAQELKQSVLNRMDAARKAVEGLSEEELEAIVGGKYADSLQTRYTTMAMSETSLIPKVSPSYNSQRPSQPRYTTMSLSETGNL